MHKYVDLHGFKFDLSGLAYILPTDFEKIGEYFMRQLRELPSAEQERKEEHLMNFCPNCGAKMEQSAEANLLEVIEIEKAINLLKRMYDVATTLPCIQNPVAYALYQTWKVYDQKRRRTNDDTGRSN